MLTRLPQPYRVSAELAREGLAQRFSAPPVALPEHEQRTVVAVLEEAGVSGGACYDGLVGLTAAAAGLVLRSLDRRAARTYERLGIAYEIPAI